MRLTVAESYRNAKILNLFEVSVQKFCSGSHDFLREKPTRPARRSPHDDEDAMRSCTYRHCTARNLIAHFDSRPRAKFSVPRSRGRNSVATLLGNSRQLQRHAAAMFESEQNPCGTRNGMPPRVLRASEGDLSPTPPDAGRSRGTSGRKHVRAPPACPTRRPGALHHAHREASPCCQRMAGPATHRR
jgi:hypothetical protein